MTATVTGQPDVELILRRVDERLARRAGDDPLPAETLAAFADAVRPLLGAGAAVDPAPLDEQARLREQLERVMKTADAEAERLNAKVTELQAKLDDSATVSEAWAQALAEAAEQRAALWELVKAAVRDRRQAWQHAAEVERALAQQSSVEHEHKYPVEQPGDTPAACRCGKPYPRAYLLNPGEYEPEEPDAWTRFFAGIREQLADWPPERRRR